MTGFLLDTNVISELRRRDRTDRCLLAWYADRVNDELWLSVLVIGELRRGVELIAQRDTVAAAPLGAWLDSILRDFADRVLPVTAAIAQRWAVITVPDPVPIIDGLLAATAIEHGLVFATRNGDDVVRTGVALVDPFAAGEA